MRSRNQQSSSTRILAALEKKKKKSVTTPFSLQTESLKAFKEIVIMFIKTVNTVNIDSHKKF